MATIPSFPQFDVKDQSNLAVRWEEHLKLFKNLMTAMDINDASRQKALLLHYVGEDVNDIFETLPDRGEEEDFKEAVRHSRNISYQKRMFLLKYLNFAR